MSVMRLVVVAVLAAGACGCGGRPQATLAGGKPVGHWVERLNDPDAKHRKEAVEKLGNVGPADPAAFPAVCGALKDTDPKVRCAAVLAVLKFGGTARGAVPVLEDMRKNDRDPQVRESAGRALDALRPAADL